MRLAQNLLPGTRVVALQPDDRESNRGDVRPQQPSRSLRHHVSLVIVPGIGEHRDLLDEWLGPRDLQAKTTCLKGSVNSSDSPSGRLAIGKLGAVSDHRCEITGVKFRA